MIVVGIAGPLASGKSTVLQMLHELRAATLRADDISRELLQPGRPELRQVREEFGEEFFAEDGILHRKKLAALIFADPQARERLNKIMHPPMVARIKHLLADYRRQPDPPAVVAMEAAILLEMGARQIIDKLLLVTAPAGVRIQRLRQRDGLGLAEARRRVQLHSELGLDCPPADYVINTEGDLGDTHHQVERLWAQLVAATPG